MAAHKRRNAGAGTAEKRKEQGRPIFLTIFAYVMIVVTVEIILLSLSIAMTNVSGRLNQNAKDILTMQVDNRVSYLQDLMQKAQNLNDLSDHIDDTMQRMLEDGTVTLDGLNVNGFFKTPFQEACEDNARLDDDDYGRWTTSVYKMVEDDRTAMAYSRSRSFTAKLLRRRKPKKCRSCPAPASGSWTALPKPLPA